MVRKQFKFRQEGPSNLQKARLTIYGTQQFNEITLDGQSGQLIRQGLFLYIQHRKNRSKPGAFHLWGFLMRPGLVCLIFNSFRIFWLFHSTRRIR